MTNGIVRPTAEPTKQQLKTPSEHPGQVGAGVFCQFLLSLGATHWTWSAWILFGLCRNMIPICDATVTGIRSEPGMKRVVPSKSNLSEPASEVLKRNAGITKVIYCRALENR